MVDINVLRLAMGEPSRYMFPEDSNGRLHVYVWLCGCRARGKEIERLAIEPCDRHVGGVWWLERP
jgi:hypothetical protein